MGERKMKLELKTLLLASVATIGMAGGVSAELKIGLANDMSGGQITPGWARLANRG